MIKNFLTGSRLGLLGFTLAGAITASHFGRKVEEAKSKQIESESRSLEEPEANFKSALNHLKSEYTMIESMSDLTQGEIQNQIDSIGEHVRQINNLSTNKSKQASDDEIIKTLFDTTAKKQTEANERQKVEQRRQERRKTKTAELRGLNGNGAHRTRARKSRKSDKNNTSTPEIGE
ncbi:hypothetical protein [Nocardiopsis alba]|uniref:hypothetical protein n=1 Tax=Nocardiopsis alba TaxID=53437 RepID=UPI0033A144D8